MAVAFFVPQAIAVWLQDFEWPTLSGLIPTAILLGLASLIINGTRWARAALVIWLGYFTLRFGVGTLVALMISPLLGIVMVGLAAGAASGASVLWFSKDVEALMSAPFPNEKRQPLRQESSVRRRLIWLIPVGVALLLGVPVIAIFAIQYLQPMWGYEGIGGSWQVVRITSPPHGPGITHQLYRKTGSGRVRVDESLTRYRFYSPDCVVYQTMRPDYSGVVFAVCGDRTPVAFMQDQSLNWDYTAEGLMLSKGTLKPIEDIVVLALQQPPYRKQWEQDAGFRRDAPYTDDLVDDVERP